jgi:hypothetical protein
MSNAALLVGNTDYQNLLRLECCHADVAMKDLLDATGKYEHITIIENKDADNLKSELRAAIDKLSSPEEIFFTSQGTVISTRPSFFFALPISTRKDQMRQASQPESYTTY